VLLSKADQKANIERNTKHKSKSKLYLCCCVPTEKNIGYFLNDPILFKRLKILITNTGQPALLQGKTENTKII